MNSQAWPTEIHLSQDKKVLSVSFENGISAKLPAELLRVESPSAEVQGHGSGQKKTPSGKRNAYITSIETVGQYAVRLVFDDGHNTGIYSWEVLYRFATDQDQMMRDYLDRLKDQGLSRD
jgi:DUF971 family protein